MDPTSFLKQFQDFAARLLDTYEQAIYLFCVRHSRLIGESEVVIGFKSARRTMAFGIGKAGSPMSEAVCYSKLRSLAQKGLIEIVATERSGTRIRVFLPNEVEGLIPVSEEAAPAQSLEEIDFFTEEPNRQRILHRDGSRCFYCLRLVNRSSYVLEHVVSRPAGDNSYRNLVTACRQCNNRKGAADAADYLRQLYREGLLDADEIKGRQDALQDLLAGRLKPPAA